MKFADINVAVGILSGMKLFRIADKKTRAAAPGVKIEDLKK